MKNIPKLLAVVSFTIFIKQKTFSQYAPSIQWQKVIGGTSEDELYAVHQTRDGGYICGGWSGSNISGDKTENCFNSSDLWIVKLDSAHNIEWQNTIGGTSADDLITISQTTDGGYIIGANSESNISGDKTEDNVGGSGSFDYWILKLDTLGNIQWQNTIGGILDDQLYSLSQTRDGGYICGGISESYISGDKTEDRYGDADFWILKLDASGNIEWQNTIGGYGYDDCRSVSQTTDGGYICGGESYSDIGGDKSEDNIGMSDFWIVKLDSTGAVQWDKTIGGDDNEWMSYDKCTLQTGDGGYIVGGASISDSSGNKTENSMGGYDYWIVKLDANGTIQWQNTIGGSSNDNFWCLGEAIGGGYYCGGRSTSGISGDKTESCRGSSDYWIVKTDASGNIQWQKTLGGAYADAFTNMSQTGDYGFICGGCSESGVSGDKTEPNWDPTFLSHDYWILKLYPDSTIGVPDVAVDQQIQFYPNPLSTRSTLTFRNNERQDFLFTLYDIIGRAMETVSTNENEISLVKGSKQPGMYLYTLVNKVTLQGFTGKLIISSSSD